MNTRFFSPPKRLVLHAVMTACIGAGLTLPLLQAMQLAAPWQLCAAACCATALLLALLDCVPRLRALAYPLMLCAIGAILWRYRGQMTAVGNAAALFLNGQPLALAAYSRALTLALSVLITGMGASLARSDHAFFPLAILAVFELLILSFLGLSSGGTTMLPLLLSLLLSSRAPGVTGRRILPMAALALALSCLLMPLAGQSVPALRQMAERTRERIDDYLFFTDPRTTFTLASTGWQPYGQERMGGPVDPADDPVMQVRAHDRALLRATSKNEYTGLAWADTTSGRRYLYISPRFSQMKSDLFDLERPDRSVLSMLPGSRTITVEMAADSASTLFLTQRFSSPKGDRLVSYFSPSTEVFGTRSLAAGDSYSFSGRLLSASSEGVRAAVLTALDESDPHLESVKETYLSLPACVESEVYEIAREITSYAGNDFDRAAALCTYLQRGFGYTLDQSEPPLTRDFVSWFLLEEKRGYCTSFASAMTVLARCAGLPARYVEGYAAVPDDDGVARVTQRDAHAWSEVYFPGFGWLAFDATPGTGGAGVGIGENAPDDSDPNDGLPPDGENDGESENESESENDGQDGEMDSTPSPSPTPSPTPTPTPTPSPSPTPEHQDPAVTPTPEITPAPTPTPSPVPPPDEPDEPDDPDAPREGMNKLAAALILLTLIAAVIARFALTTPARVARKYRNPGDRVLIFYRACEQALAAMGMTPKSGEAPATFLWRAHEALNGRVNLTDMGRLLCMARYSGRRVKASAAIKGENAYYALLDCLTPMQRIRMHLARFAHGLKLE